MKEGSDGVASYGTTEGRYCLFCFFLRWSSFPLSVTEKAARLMMMAVMIISVIAIYGPMLLEFIDVIGI